MMLRYLLLIPVLLVAYSIVGSVLLRRAVNRALRARGLKRSGPNPMILVNPAPGWRVIETCHCLRGEERVLVIILAAGWFSHRLNISERPEPADTQQREGDR